MEEIEEVARKLKLKEEEEERRAAREKEENEKQEKDRLAAKLIKDKEEVSLKRFLYILNSIFYKII